MLLWLLHCSVSDIIFWFLFVFIKEVNNQGIVNASKWLCQGNTTCHTTFYNSTDLLLTTILLYKYIYIFVCMCVWVNVCLRVWVGVCVIVCVHTGLNTSRSKFLDFYGHNEVNKSFGRQEKILNSAKKTFAVKTECNSKQRMLKKI